MPKEKMFLLGENLHVFAPPTPVSFSPGDVWLKGALGPLKAATVNSSGWGFGWVLSVLLSIKMNCQYVLCPDNHLVETQKSCKIETR